MFAAIVALHRDYVAIFRHRFGQIKVIPKPALSLSFFGAERGKERKRPCNKRFMVGTGQKKPDRLEHYVRGDFFSATYQCQNRSEKRKRRGGRREKKNFPGQSTWPRSVDLTMRDGTKLIGRVRPGGRGCASVRPELGASRQSAAS